MSQAKQDVSVLEALAIGIVGEMSDDEIVAELRTLREEQDRMRWRMQMLHIVAAIRGVNVRRPEEAT